MFRRKKKHRHDREVVEGSPDDLFAGLGLGANLSDPYHMAHYRFAFVVVPMWLFGSNSPDLVRMLLGGTGRAMLGALWFSTNAEFDLEQEAFVFEEKHAEGGDIHFVVNMPATTGSPNEAHFLGIGIPRAVIESLESGGGDTTGVRLIYLESSIFGLTIVGESQGPGNHLNLGGGPDPTRDGMWQVMTEVFVTRARNPAGGVSIEWDDDE